jgi:hypothetical protein
MNRQQRRAAARQAKSVKLDPIITSHEGGHAVAQVKASLVVTIFEMENRLGYYVPRINFHFEEADTGISWLINAGGTRCYVARGGRFKTLDWEDQAADSHFMVGRVVSALIMASAGLFTPDVKGRLIFHDVEHQEWQSQVTADISWSDEVKRVHSSFSTENFSGWLRAPNGSKTVCI